MVFLSFENSKAGFAINGHAIFEQVKHPALLGGGVTPQGCLNPVISYSSRDGNPAPLKVLRTGFLDHNVR